ncbi:MAG: twin-arginine translocase subunit TatC [Crocinitomicaceae bacterium]|nr:twin-arginine translocase subunit TatC [Crocinitomicaceae bacterium]
MAEAETQQDMGFMDHLEELRRRLFYALVGILAAAIVLFVAKDWVFERLIFAPRDPNFITFRAWCALSHLTGAGDRLCVTDIRYELITTTMLGNFSAHILVSAIGGFIVSFPLTFRQIWQFIRPGLHGEEASAVRGVTWAASILFFAGVCFGYFVIAPLSLQFLGHYEIGDVEPRIALMSYLKTVASITLAAGLIFQVPVLMHFLAKMGLVTPTGLRKFRKHTLVVTLILAAIITPPDLTSQVLVALPVLGLYEIGILQVKRIFKRQQAEARANPTSER